MEDIKGPLSKIWKNVVEYCTGEDHESGLFHLNKKQYKILKDEYLLEQSYVNVKSLYLPNGVDMPCENYYFYNLDGSALTPEDVHAVELKRTAIKRNEYLPAAPKPRA
jgi:hypothetical protein|tara:strand:- start:707 stop:1030 length:324 start_codon:yes stop_codon:yes gene_type:complete